MKDILVSMHDTGVALIEINRPKEYNALRTKLLCEIAQALDEFEANNDIKAVILTGNEKAFAAGADIKEMADKTAVDILNDPRMVYWQRIKSFPKPLIAAVNGFCLGGGNELAMMCDIIIAGSKAKFGQPEVNLGIIPGAGGTQRLTQAIGKYKTMRYILTGEFMSAQEAYEFGLVSEICEPEETTNKAIEIATTIASKAPVAIQLAKEAIKQASESLIEQGSLFERKAFSILFSTEDKKEGVAAFQEKRKPVYKGK
jgi:enoyl-CoA hydratase